MKPENIFKAGFVIEACRDGTFIVSSDPEQFRRGLGSPRWALSNIGDLLAWLTKQAAEMPSRAGATSGHPYTFLVQMGAHLPAPRQWKPLAEQIQDLALNVDVYSAEAEVDTEVAMLRAFASRLGVSLEDLQAALANLPAYQTGGPDAAS